mmetsp:Transcript_93770/g.261058  ORF Transcript_93770/g.261058 Transcript_93770/m.261058 type:complete len:270 (+) Transcript_93770:565-1374(+)
MQLVPGGVEVGPLADVIHLCGHDDALGSSPEVRAQDGRGQLAAVRQARREALQGGARRPDVVGVRCDVEHGTLGLVEDAGLELPEPRRDGLPAAGLDLVQHLGEILVLRQTAEALIDPACLRRLCTEPPGGNDVTVGDEAGLRPGLRLAQQLHKALLVAQVDRERDLLHKVHELRHLGDHGLPTEDEVRHWLLGAAPADADVGGRDPPRAHAYAASQTHEVALGGAELPQGTCEEGKQRLEVLRHGIEAEGDVRVDDAAGRELVDQCGR